MASETTATSTAPLRLSVCLNAGPKKGIAAAALLVPPQTEAVLAAATNKLRLKKKEVARARLFVWRTGWELPRGEGIVQEGRVRNDDLIAISLGEPYAGPCKLDARPNGVDPTLKVNAPCEAAIVDPPVLSGADDSGRAYSCLQELWDDQAANHEAYYEANAAWWDADGYGGSTDEEAMIGDGGSSEDLEHSLRLLDQVRAMHPAAQGGCALDAGAGVGRVTKHVLLRRYERVTLLEPCERWLKQARRYLGNKRAQRCAFVSGRLENYAPSNISFDLIWIQWALQYLIDAHVVDALRRLAARLAPHGVMVLKENRPLAGDGAFHVDVPHGPHGRYDVTRPDAHHRWLFRCAHLEIEHSEIEGEVTAWVLRPSTAALEGLRMPSLEARVEARAEERAEARGAMLASAHSSVPTPRSRTAASDGAPPTDVALFTPENPQKL